MMCRSGAGRQAGQPLPNAHMSRAILRDENTGSPLGRGVNFFIKCHSSCSVQVNFIITSWDTERIQQKHPILSSS